MNNSSEKIQVSVVIPCYNLAHFLAESIESVLNQEFTEPVNLEVIVIDDGSTDGSSLIAKRYGQDVRYFYQENAGLAAALNLGLAQAEGEYILFLDADDRLSACGIQAGLACFGRNHKADFVYGGFSRIDFDGTEIHGVLVEPCPPDPYLHLLRENYIRMHSAVLYRTQAVKAQGGFNESLTACEDYDLFFRIARSGKEKLASHANHVAEYRTYNSSMSADPKKMLQQALIVLRAQRPHFDVYGVCEAAFQEGERFWNSYYSDTSSNFLPSDESKQVKARSSKMERGNNMSNNKISRALERPLQENVQLARKKVWRLARRSGLVGAAPSVGTVSFGDLRRVRPFDGSFGASRGLPVDRYYIERFLAAHSHHIRGRVLEIGDTTYTETFGGEAVVKAEALHISDPTADFTGDIVSGESLPSGAFDCAIITQTLHLLDDVPRAIATIKRILKPGGVALLTVPGVTQIASDEWGKIWRSSFTLLSLSETVEGVFSPEGSSYSCYGNVLAASSLLYGVASDELRKDELEFFDERYPVTVAACCIK